MEVLSATENDVNILLPALLELRPHLSEVSFRETFAKQISEGYQLIYIGDSKMAYAIAGFRTLHFLFSGKTLYIDDLITHSAHRRKGYAGRLLDWIITYAGKNDYRHLSLDSGIQRKDAHRLYLNKGLEVESLHFGRKVSEIIR